MDEWSRYLRGPRGAAASPSKTIRVLDLFSGVGGLALGFAHAALDSGLGVASAGAVDNDSAALDVYARNHETERTFSGSVSALVDFQVRGRGSAARFLYEPELTNRALWHPGSVDAILAGPPCQGHSSLNNRTRGEDDRNKLYLTVPAMAVATNAETVIIENVPGVVRAKENVVDAAVALLHAADYRVSMGVLAADQLGWPQTRKRFFLVASRSLAPMSMQEIAATHARPPLPVSWAIADLIDRTDDHLDEVAEVSAENVARVAWLFDNDAYDTPLHMRPDCHKEGTSYTAVYGRMRWDAPAPTLTTGFLTMGRGRFIHPLRQRTITPREAARIQGFPDWFDFNDATLPARKDLAKWIGNAVPTILGYTAAQAMMRVATEPSRLDLGVE
jgi:DNA (cytosine-5)-methyltransferase 1